MALERVPEDEPRTRLLRKHIQPDGDGDRSITIIGEPGALVPTDRRQVMRMQELVSKLQFPDSAE